MLALVRYGDGTVRLTVEQNLLFPNVPEDRLDEMRQVTVIRSCHAVVCFRMQSFPRRACVYWLTTRSDGRP